MVSLETVRANNASLKELGPGLVAVFVGGTSGIGETTAREFVRDTVKPTVYLVGRNGEAASRIIDELQKLNPEGKISFVKSDISLLRNIDTACDDIKSKEEKINLLFMSSGILDFSGRTETSEGLDRKLNLHYYSRMRFAYNLLPQLTAASKVGGLSRVISVLAAGMEAKVDLNDLSLKSNYSLMSCARHAQTMNSFAAEELAAATPGTTFIHAYPRFVKTGLAKNIHGITKYGLEAMSFLLTPMSIPLGQSGERHLYAATSKTYPPFSKPDESAVTGSTGVKGSGAYLISWDGKPSGNDAILKDYRAQGVGKQIWEHTLHVFDKVCGKDGGKY